MVQASILVALITVGSGNGPRSTVWIGNGNRVAMRYDELLRANPVEGTALDPASGKSVSRSVRKQKKLLERCSRFLQLPVGQGRSWIYAHSLKAIGPAGDREPYEEVVKKKCFRPSQSFLLDWPIRLDPGGKRVT
jgi:hypothetical protein